MQVTVTAKDTLTADLQRAVRGVSADRRRAAMEAVGLGLASMAKRSFNTDHSLRPAPWPNKKDGSPSTLQKSTRLRQSVRVTAVTADSVAIGSDAKYSAIHQLGGKTNPHLIKARFQKALAVPGFGIFRQVKHPGSKIPARPYLPFHKDGTPSARADKMIRDILTKKLLPPGG